MAPALARKAPAVGLDQLTISRYFTLSLRFRPRRAFALEIARSPASATGDVSAQWGVEPAFLPHPCPIVVADQVVQAVGAAFALAHHLGIYT